MLTAEEIVKGLKGTNAAARFFGVKPPSVTGWLRSGAIPDDKLVRKAALLERRFPGQFNRREVWPDTYGEIWPELDELALSLGTPSAPRAELRVVPEGS